MHMQYVNANMQHAGMHYVNMQYVNAMSMQTCNMQYAGMHYVNMRVMSRFAINCPRMSQVLPWDMYTRLVVGNTCNTWLHGFA